MENPDNLIKNQQSSWNHSSENDHDKFIKSFRKLAHSAL